MTTCAGRASESGVPDWKKRSAPISAASRIKKLAGETPASFICFDLIASGDDDLRGTRFGVRRARLEEEIRADLGCLPDQETGRRNPRLLHLLRPDRQW